MSRSTTIAIIIICLLVVVFCSLLFVYVSLDKNDSPTDTQNQITEQKESENGVYPGYNLFSPLASTLTYLIDNDGQLIHSWESNYIPGNSVYLLENGNLMRTGKVNSTIFTTGGQGGIVEEIDWEGNIIWSYMLANDNNHLHHDIEPMPSGNVLMIAWDKYSSAEALEAGMDSEYIPEGGVWAEKILEVDPSNDSIVWEWKVWEHLGTNGEDPSKININHYQPRESDWLHINSIDYNEELDQIILSVHNFNEIWIISHSSDGDLLYRWGNPATFNNSVEEEQHLYLQHDAQWIPDKYPGEGNILIFNNGDRRDRSYSNVLEIKPPLDENGNYDMSKDSEIIWNYQATNPEDFYAENVSGAQRLINGNTLICSGPTGYIFEITQEKDIVWEYTNPIKTTRGNETMNSIFRFERYDVDYPAFVNIDLSPKGDLN